MLLNTTSSFKKDDIITIKNTLGEEIVSKYISEDATHYTLDTPLALGMGQNGIGFAPAVASGVMDGHLEFPKVLAMWAVPTNAEITSMYIQTTTGLAVPGGNQKIIT